MTPVSCRSLLVALFSLFAMMSPSLVLADQLYPPELCENVSPTIQKIYVTPDQVVLTTEGIFFLSSDGVMTMAGLVAVDTDGLYVLSQDNYICPACGRGSRGNKCTFSDCPMNGIR